MTEADVREMVSVICALEMDSDTISAILFIMKMIMMSVSRNIFPRNGVESLRDISEKKSGNQYLYYTSPILSEVNLPSETVYFFSASLIASTT